jgi:uncharacterized protein YjbI with pentapeptide repeats
MLRRRLNLRVLAAATGAGLASLTIVAAAPAAMAATCPQVDSTTGAVTPTPSPGVDWSGCDLAGANLAGANLASADLSNANLTNAGATGAQFVSANLTGATLTNIDLDNANVTGSNLTSTDLTTAQLVGLRSASITGSPVLPSEWVIYNAYLVGPNANLAGADLTGLTDTTGVELGGTNLTDVNLSNASLPSEDLTDTNLTSADLTGADLADGDFTNTTLTDANLTSASLDGADLDTTAITGVIWLNTTCPNGTSSNAYDSGCESALNVTPPLAHPYLPAAEVNGWFNAPATVEWDWTDAGPLNAAKCPSTSTTVGNGLQTLSTTCTDLAGNSASVDVDVDVDTTRPAVTLKGVSVGGHYALGRVPAVCATRESVSGVGHAATVRLSGGRHGVGAITVTCAGAVSVAGLGQAAPVSRKVTVGYGFGGFTAPRNGALVTAGRSLTVRFRLMASRSADVRAATGIALARGHDVRVILAGPGIAPAVAVCGWSGSAREFTCTIRVPSKIKTGRRSKYTITAVENVGTGLFAAPASGKTANPETISFR